MYSKNYKKVLYEYVGDLLDYAANKQCPKKPQLAESLQMGTRDLSLFWDRYVAQKLYELVKDQ